jgi:hypothetical protein
VFCSSCRKNIAGPVAASAAAALVIGGAGQRRVSLAQALRQEIIPHNLTIQ